MTFAGWIITLITFVQNEKLLMHCLRQLENAQVVFWKDALFTLSPLLSPTGRQRRKRLGGCHHGCRGSGSRPVSFRLLTGWPSTICFLLSNHPLSITKHRADKKFLPSNSVFGLRNAARKVFARSPSASTFVPLSFPNHASSCFLPR